MNFHINNLLQFVCYNSGMQRKKKMPSYIYGKFSYVGVEWGHEWKLILLENLGSSVSVNKELFICLFGFCYEYG